MVTNGTEIDLIEIKGRLVVCSYPRTETPNTAETEERLTMIVKDGVIKAVHYPVFPSDSDPSWVMDKLSR